MLSQRGASGLLAGANAPTRLGKGEEPLERSTMAGSAEAPRVELNAPGREVTWSALMASAQRGDKVAYRRLLLEITPYIRKLVARRVWSPEDREDTVQDVLLTVHSIRHTFEPGRPFAPWLVTIATRRAFDRLRRGARVRAHEVASDSDYETFVAGEANNEFAGLEAEELRQAIERLPPGQRQAVTLLKLREMSLEEASSATGLSVSALKVATHRAIKALKIMVRRG